VSWDMVLLGDVLKTSAGGTPLKSKKEYYDGGNIPWLLSGEICNKNITHSKNYITVAGVENSSAKLFPPNTTLIAMYGATAGQVGILRFSSATNQAVCGILPSDKFLPEFLFYYLSHYKETLLLEVSGVAQPNLSQVKIKNVPIPNIAIELQKKLVAKLDAIFAEIDKATAAAEANAKNAEALFQSYLTQVFERGGEGFLSTTLGNFYDVRDGTHDSPKFHESGYPLVTSKNLKKGAISFEKIQYVSKDDYLSISQRSGVKKGDVLMAMIGTIGNPVVIETDAEFAIKNVALFKTDNNQSPHFLRYYLGSDYVIRKMEKDAKGATQKFVGLGYLRSFPINVPPFDIQISVVKELEDYERHTKKLFSSYQSKLNQLINLKQSILKQAFNGELVKE